MVDRLSIGLRTLLRSNGSHLLRITNLRLINNHSSLFVFEALRLSGLLVSDGIPQNYIVGCDSDDANDIVVVKQFFLSSLVAAKPLPASEGSSVML